MIHTKLFNSRKSVFSAMSELIGEQGAVDMTVGRSDFPCPPRLIELAHEHMLRGMNNYSPIEGVVSLREVIAGIIEKQHGVCYNPEKEITITAGCIQAATTAISALVGDGDEVIIFEPAFDSYVPAVELNGGRPVYVSLKAPDFHIDWDEVRKRITLKTKMIIINFPHNPTGSVLSEEDMKQLKRLVNGTNIVILSDENFKHLVYDNKKHQSIADYEDLAERSIMVSSFGSVYNINGWGIAYCAAPEKLMAEFRKIHQFQVFNVNTPLQYALADFLKEDKTYLEISDFYQGKRNYFNRLLKDTGFEFIPSQGSYFQVLNYASLSDEKEPDFAVRLAREYGVAALPISIFQHEKNNSQLLRFCFAKSNETLELAAERLASVPALI
ncbi:aminotransferase class I/II-fold pyridoxal phosphate-dependent enzyme [Puteibacter caeruleilacunae]|nr:aminotransferase class I/II-fold pyridoxal phosphate-dependent enzyme [Puteibacter caeruleilacunae]